MRGREGNILREEEEKIEKRNYEERGKVTGRNV